MFPSPHEPDPFEVVPPPDADTSQADAETEAPRTAYRGSNNDPTFGYLIALALAIGLTPMLPGGADMRYTLAWGVMAGFGVLSWLLGNLTRIGQEAPEDLTWGIVFGLIISAPLLLVGGGTLATSVRLLFDLSGDATAILPAGVVLAYLVFVMPLAETLFFRGVLQETRAFWIVGIMSTIWSLVLFAPMLDLLNYPGVAVLIGVALITMNMIFGYVRDRNGLAAAWLCQITVNIVLLFIPYVSG